MSNAVKKEHSDLVFCSWPCRRCDRLMVLRAEIHRGKRLRQLRQTMQEVPRG